MAEFFEQIIGFFEAIGLFISNIVGGLVFIVTMIPKGMATVTVMLGYLPSPLLAFAVFAITISAVYLIIGR